jgi:hypothetical protein
MKAITAHALCIRECVVVCHRAMTAMEGGVETGDLGRSGGAGSERIGAKLFG